MSSNSTKGDTAISVRGLSKSYTIAHNSAKHTTAAEALVHKLKNPLQKPEKETFWALQDVDFDIKKGDVVGIIGRNGAGKSTLLKILSRITEPTTGQIDLHGRVGSLLEVGTGFHPELTGRENIFLNGAILGMSRVDIARQFDAIVEFSGTEKFLDTPVKRYSSGMYVRLAFAVAAHLNNDILIVDEVLAVGDYAFQQKCLNRMQDVSNSGNTVLIVSHNMAVLGEIAKSAVWLQKGRVRDIGNLNDIIGKYLSDQAVSGGQWELEQWDDAQIAAITHLRLLQEEQEVSGDLVSDKAFDFELRYTLRREMPFCRVGVILYTSTGIVVFSTAEPDSDGNSPCDRAAGTYTARCTVPAWLLSPGGYVATLHIDDAPNSRHFTADQVFSFSVVETALRGMGHQNRPGIISPKLDWAVSQDG